MMKCVQRNCGKKRKYRLSFATPETRKGLDFHLDPSVFVVGRAGFEPATNGLKVRCSTS